MKEPTFYHRSTIAESRFPFFATLYYTERTFAAVQINFINSHMHTRGEFHDSLQRDDLSIEEKVRSSGVKSLHGRVISLASNNTCVSRYLEVVQIFTSEPTERAYPMHSQRVPDSATSLPIPCRLFDLSTILRNGASAWTFAYYVTIFAEGCCIP